MKFSLVLMLALACPQRSAPPPADAAAPRIILPDHSAVIVEVASDDATREQGLMYRDHLAEDRGMIFLFPQAGEYPFWMKNTLIPLDMIWMDSAHHIVHIAHDVPPCKADPCPAAKHHLRDGDALRFEGMDAVVVR